jgi:hypothetical protein
VLRHEWAGLVEGGIDDRVLRRQVDRGSSPGGPGQVPPHIADQREIHIPQACIYKYDGTIHARSEVQVDKEVPEGPGWRVYASA